MPELSQLDAYSPSEHGLALSRDQQAVGSALRALHKFLTTADPNGSWGGLRPTPTLDGNLLWLCDEHRELHVAKPLVLPQ